VIVACRLVARQISRVCRDLIHVRGNGILEIFEFEHEDRVSGENDNIGSSPALSRQFVLESDTPVTNVRASGSQSSQLILQDPMRIQPSPAVRL